MTRKSQRHVSKAKRRKVIQALGSAGILGLAGCTNQPGDSENEETTTESSNGDSENTTTESDSGNGGSDVTEIIHTPASADTLSYQVVQAIAAEVNEYADGITAQARANEGSRANPRELANEATDIANISAWVSNEFVEGNEPYNQFDFTPHALRHFHDVQYLWVTPNDWENFDEMEAGAVVNPGPSGSTVYAPNSHAMDTIVESAGLTPDDLEYAGLNYNQQAGALQEGTLDVATIAMVNGFILAGWSQELANTVDVNLLGYPDGSIQTMTEDPSLTISETDLSEYADLFRYTPTDGEMATPTIAIYEMVRGDYPVEPLKEYLSTMWERRDALQERHGVLTSLQEDEFWVANAFANRPFHPAAAEFYQEKGIWQDEFESG